MVPADPTSLIVCFLALRSSAPSLLFSVTTDFSGLRSSLNGLPTGSWNGTCQETSQDFGLTYYLTFGYAQGPPVQVMIIPGWLPGVTNGSLQAENATSILALVQQLQAQH